MPRTHSMVSRLGSDNSMSGQFCVGFCSAGGMETTENELVNNLGTISPLPWRHECWWTFPRLDSSVLGSILRLWLHTRFVLSARTMTMHSAQDGEGLTWLLFALFTTSGLNLDVPTQFTFIASIWPLTAMMKVLVMTTTWKFRSFG